MSKVKTTCEVKTYSDTAKPSIRVHNHWNNNQMVEIEVNGERFVVLASDLEKAIRNCTNVQAA